MVRLAPDVLSFIDSQAWKDIYGFGKTSQFLKDPDAYDLPANNVPSVFSAFSPQMHARMRKIFSHAFSERALREQEPIFTKYVGVLVQRLKVEAAKNLPLDMVKWLNFTTFDIMGDLTFGEPLGLLDKSAYTPWVTLIFATLKIGAYARVLKEIPVLKHVFLWFIPKNLKDKRKTHFQFSVDRVTKRLASKSERPDIWTMVLRNADDGKLSLTEMHSNAALFMGAGTETTATELSGLFYHLAINPDKMAKLIREIRTEFHQDGDITMERLAGMKYLNCCVEEGLRIFMPVPIGLPRISNTDAMIANVFVPAGTKVSVPQYASYHSALHFKDPDSFVPERWIPGNVEYAGDNKAAFAPFSIGPRNCIGKNMAYHEIRLMVTKLLWNFDFALAPESVGWTKQRVYSLWEKHPLMMILMPVERE